MIYRTNTKNNDQISQLSFGCMRFPKNIDETRELVKSAIDRGVNYFDTAYMYGGSEHALGTALKATGLREKVKIATKLPIIMCKTRSSFDKYFNIQKERLKTDYVDYYLLHMLCEVKTLKKLQSIGLDDWVAEKKASGEIRSFGFSFHGERHDFTNLIDAYDWDFCQIQYNYYDENNQAGRHGLNYAAKKGIPVIAMSPLRGGLLSDSIASEAKEIFNNAESNRSLTDWSLRWLWDQPEILTVLSGMSNMNQLDENISIAASVFANCLSENEKDVYKQVIAALNKTNEIPCTGCGYCLPCPYGVNIPDCLSIYNERGGFTEKIRRYLMATGALAAKQSYASQCIKCGVCEPKCPQQIKIGNELEKVSRKIESFWFKPLFSLARKIMGIKN